MQRFLLYMVLVIAYLGLAKLISPSEYGVQYLPNSKSFTSIFSGSNINAILIDEHATGFLIKTYYQKYRVIYGPNHAEDIIVRTSKDFAKKNKSNIGMSLFRTYNGKSSTLIMPPGSEYIGNENYGEWKTTKSGDTVWKFYRPYQRLARFLGWGKYRPDKIFFEEMKVHQLNEKPYYGNHHQFGFNGEITRKNFPDFFKEERMKKISLNELVLEYFKQKF